MDQLASESLHYNLPTYNNTNYQKSGYYDLKLEASLRKLDRTGENGITWQPSAAFGPRKATTL
jgi:hypothetical protein